MQSTFKKEKLERRTRAWLLFFMITLLLTGITAMPSERELSIATKILGETNAVGRWLNTVYVGVKNTASNYPYLFYGYDWLAFAHIILAILFIGPYKNPVRNKWVIEFGAIACLFIIPFALFIGYFRGIPLWWRLIDCSFGVVGLFPLGICYRAIIKLESINKENVGL